MWQPQQRYIVREAGAELDVNEPVVIVILRWTGTRAVHVDRICVFSSYYAETLEHSRDRSLVRRHPSLITDQAKKGARTNSTNK